MSDARHLVREFLRHSPRACEAELIAAELMSNAIRHTPSGDAGGTFTLTLRHGPGRVRIEVVDQGNGAWAGGPDGGTVDGEALLPDLAVNGRGLMLVAALADACGHEADACGHEADASGGQTSWATLTW